MYPEGGPTVICAHALQDVDARVQAQCNCEKRDHCKRCQHRDHHVRLRVGRMLFGRHRFSKIACRLAADYDGICM